MGLHGDDQKEFVSLIFSIDDTEYILKKEVLDDSIRKSADSFETYELLPFSLHKVGYKELGMNVEILAYSPLIPYDLAESSVPALCIEMKIINKSDKILEGSVRLEQNGSYTDNSKMQAFWKDKRSKDLRFNVSIPRMVKLMSAM